MSFGKGFSRLPSPGDHPQPKFPASPQHGRRGSNAKELSLNFEQAFGDGELLGWIGGAALSAFCLVQGLIKGTAGSAMTRKRSPAWFWCSMCFFAASLVVTSYQLIVRLR